MADQVGAAIDRLLPGYWVDAASGAWCTLPWPSDEDELRDLVRNSLGPYLIEWSEGRTALPGLVDYQSKRPWRWTRGQKKFLILWYSVDESGQFRYRSGVKRGAKGTGKDPQAAATCNCELAGPVEFSDWDRDPDTGLLMGRPRGFPLVQVMSNSQEQSKDVLRVANGMWSAEAREFYGLDCGQTRTTMANGGRFEVPPSAEESAEGDPATHIALNESHHMTPSNGGDHVAAVARRNVAKSPRQIRARLVEYTNAHQPGRGSVAEESFVAWQKQSAPQYTGKRDILYDSIEAPPDVDILTAEGRRRGLRAAYMDAEWNDLERIADEMVDPRTSTADSIRFYLNGLAADEDVWVEPANFDALAAADTVVADEDQVAIFLDCSKSGDATGFTATRLRDMFTWVGGVWECPRGWNTVARGRWLAPRGEVDAAVRSTLDRFDVVWCGIDPSPAEEDDSETLYWQAMIDGLHQDFRDKLIWATPGSAELGHSVLFDMRLSQRGAYARMQKFTSTAMLLQQWIDEEKLLGPLRHDGHPTLRQHVHNARQRANQWGTSLGKITRDSDKKIDLAVCMVGSVMGARIAANSPRLKKKKAPGRALFC